ncbi:MAG: hypothetical protein GY918_14175, partial [Gammaproteobacteria bacterium]|nr:hypothetical protein [Gammaproteobacteria bacterium]
MVLDFSAVPESLQSFAEEHWQKIIAQTSASQQQQIETLLSDSAVQQPFMKTLSCSLYLAQLWQKKPDLLLSFLQHPHLFSAVDEAYFIAVLEQGVKALPSNSDMALDAFIRKLRHVEQARFIFQDCNRLCSMPQLTQELSFFADACIQAVSDWHYAQLQAKHG